MARMKRPPFDSMGHGAPEPSTPDGQIVETPTGRSIELGESGEIVDHADLEAIQSLLEQLDDAGAKIEIYKLTDDSGGTGVRTFIFRTRPEEIGEVSALYERVQKEYGGGKYVAVFRRKNGKIARTADFSVAQTRESIEHKQAAGDVAGILKSATDMQRVAMEQMRDAKSMFGSDGLTVKDLLPLLAHRNNDGDDKLITVMQGAAQQAQTQMMAMMTLVTTMMAESQKSQAQILASVFGTLPNMVQRNDDRGSRDMMAMLLSHIQKTHSTQVNPLDQLLAMTKVVGEFQKLTPAEREEKAPSMLERAIELLLPPIAGVMTAKFAGVPAVIAQPDAGNALPQPAHDDEPIETVDDSTPHHETVSEERKEMTKQLETFLQMAERHFDTRAAASMLRFSMDSENMERLIQLLSKPDWLDLLQRNVFGGDVRVTKNAEWFSQVREIIMSTQ